MRKRAPWKLLDKSEYFEPLKVVLVLLVCVNQFDKGWISPLEGVKYDFEVLKELFEGFYRWKVKSVFGRVTKEEIMGDGGFFPNERARLQLSKKKYDGLIIVLCGHGTLGTFVASDDAGANELDEDTQKRIALKDISDFWNNKNATSLKGKPKIIIKVACRGTELGKTVKVRRGGEVGWIHSNAETVNIYATMPGDAGYDNRGKGESSYFVHYLNEILRNKIWNKENLFRIVLRLRRKVAEATKGKEWVHFDSAQSRLIYFSKNTQKEKGKGKGKREGNDERKEEEFESDIDE